jgi:hypothetical protein
VVPRVVCFGAKAAPGYQMAKLIIKLINSVAAVVNHDPAVGHTLKVVFLPNFNVTLAERIYPAADLSEQISLAGKEASGTGNMKFALNGALTIGTLDGANVEIRELVGAKNFFLFGLTEEQVTATRAAGYHPRDSYERNPALRQAIDQIAAGVFAPREPDVFRPIVDALLETDAYLVLADYESYVAAQDAVEQTYRDAERWTRMSILNTARCGYFSSDRSIRDYASQIWQVQPVDVAAWQQIQTGSQGDNGRRSADIAGIELSEAEWALLDEAPGTISSVMLAVTDSGLIGTVLEEGAVAHAPASTARRFATNLLITTVLRRMKGQTRTFRPTYQVRSQSGNQTRERSGVEPRTRGDTEMLALCGQIADLLEQKIAPPQALEFKEWLLAIGEAVANAAAEGGFVTVGGATTDDREATMLQAMRSALRVVGTG